MVVNGWTLLFHEAIIGQLEQLSRASARARKSDPEHFRSHANVKLFAALSKLVLETIPTSWVMVLCFRTTCSTISFEEPQGDISELRWQVCGDDKVYTKSVLKR